MGEETRENMKSDLISYYKNDNGGVGNKLANPKTNTPISSPTFSSCFLSFSTPWNKF